MILPFLVAKLPWDIIHVNALNYLFFAVIFVELFGLKKVFLT